MGLAPVLISDLTKSALLGLDPDASPSTVKLWAGFNTAFMISLVIIATGTLLAVFRRPVAHVQAVAGTTAARGSHRPRTPTARPSGRSIGRLGA